jgi:hypothetical protein
MWKRIPSRDQSKDCLAEKRLAGAKRKDLEMNSQRPKRGRDAKDF